MTTLNYTVKFHKTVLASFIGFFLSQSCFALEAMSDEKLSDTTGEGIALLPQDTYMVFRGAGANESATQLLDRTKDTGFVNYIPVGPLSLTAADTNKNGSIDSGDLAVGKADLYLYGLALSKANDADPNDVNERVGMLKTGTTATAINAIKSWGTATNPWLFKVDTDSAVPTFTPDGGTKNTDTGKVTYLSIEAPAYEATKDANGSDAYKLKLGTWADAFVRNPNVIDGNSGQFNYGSSDGTIGTTTDTTRANRIRLQAIWNNFSLNGSKIQIFQTLNGATSAGGMSPFYNNTLGIAGVIRLNSGAADTLRLTGSAGTVTESSTTTTWNTVHSGQNSTLSATATAASGNCGNAGSTGAISSSIDGCNYIVQKGTRTDTQTLSASTWGVTNGFQNNVLRLSTQETADSANAGNLLYTPALDLSGNAKAPTFASNEGIYIYNPNINLVLGSLYQPLILGSDGKNFSLELARIPNKESIYKKIYTDYTGADTSYLGSTCNIYQCGTPIKDASGNIVYQGNNATHSSISIGSIYSDDGGKTLKAYTGADAVGISFGAITNSVAQTNSATVTGYQWALRQAGTVTWVQNSKCTSAIGSNYCSTVAPSNGSLSEWKYWNGSSLANSLSGAQQPVDAVACKTGSGTGYGTCNNSSTSNPSGTQLYATTANRTWSATNLNGAAWLTSQNTNVDNLLGIPGATANYPTANQAIAPTASASFNNLGSAVIDGLLIQHMKITTKGL